MNLVETIDTPVGSYAPDFEIPGIDDQVHHLRRYLEKFRAVGVISMCNHCPYVEWYIDRLKKYSMPSFVILVYNIIFQCFNLFYNAQEPAGGSITT